MPISGSIELRTVRRRPRVGAVRVLHIIETLDFGGAEKVLVDLVEATRSQASPTVCCVKHSGELATRLHPSVSVVELGKGEGNDWRLPWRLAKLVQTGGISVMHSHTWGVYLESALAARLTGVPLVHTVHGHYMNYPAGLAARIKMNLRHALERRAAHWHCRVVAVSRAIHSFLVDELGFDARLLETIHNGIDCRIPMVPRRQGATFITVGRLAAVKNQAMLLRSFGVVARERPAARLIVVGDGPERASLEALAAELGVAEQVKFLGFRDDVTQLLAEADVFLMSSHYEGISIAVLEAMRAGLAVVGTRVGGMSETVEHGRTGWLVADNDEEGFTEAMREALADPIRRIASGGAGQVRQQREFSLDQAARRYMALYAGKVG